MKKADLCSDENSNPKGPVCGVRTFRQRERVHLYTCSCMSTFLLGSYFIEADALHVTTVMTTAEFCMAVLNDLRLKLQIYNFAISFPAGEHL